MPQTKLLFGVRLGPFGMMALPLDREPERSADDVVRVVLAAEIHIVEHRGTSENFFQKKIRSPTVNVLPAVLGCPPK